MNWPDDFIDKIICGDCLEVMREMPDECVDMALTSPPYWGLRDYGIEQIFGGNGDCEHDFNLIHRRIGDKSGVHGPSSTIGAKKAQHEARKGEATKTCNKCHAWKGQLGLEPQPEMYIEHLTQIFNEVKRVLKKEGTLWLNIGDTYWSAKGSCFNPGGGKNSLEDSKKKKAAYPLHRGNKSDVPNLPQKCLTMIPERLAWSLIQSGWILRNKNIWYKKNAMPSSIKDRFSNRWEYVFFFSKSHKAVYWTNRKTLKLVTKQPAGIKGIEEVDWKWERCPRCEGCGEITKEAEEGPKKCSRCNGSGEIKMSFWTAHDYYFDLDAVREPYTEPLNRWGGDKIGIPKKTKWKSDNEKTKWAMSVREMKARPCPAGKNPGDVFEINSQPFPEAHFAVFPEKLCEKPIKAGCPEEVCKKCGKARERITKTDYIKTRPSAGNDKRSRNEDRLSEARGHGGWRGNNLLAEVKTIGWTSCDCNAGFEPGIVLDPFAGAGTALFVAKQLRRKFLGIDIKKEYCEMSEKRLAQGVL